MHFGCVELVDHHVSTRSSWRARQAWHAPHDELTRHVKRVEPMHFGCVKLVEQHGSTYSSRHARHVKRVETWRDELSGIWALCNVYANFYYFAYCSICQYVKQWCLTIIAFVINTIVNTFVMQLSISLGKWTFIWFCLMYICFFLCFTLLPLTKHS